MGCGVATTGVIFLSGLCAVALSPGGDGRSDQRKPEIHHRHDHARASIFAPLGVMTLLAWVSTLPCTRYHRAVVDGTGANYERPWRADAAPSRLDTKEQR